MKKYIFLLISLATFSGCGYLDEEPTQWVGIDDVFGSENSYLKPVNEVYRYIRSGHNRVNGAFLDAATNDAMGVNPASTVHKLAQGYLSSTSPIENCWDNSYQGIQKALFASKYLLETPLFLNKKTEEEVARIKAYYIAEMDCLRALLEYDLLKTYGGFPIVDRYYEWFEEEVNRLGRNSFEECVNHIVTLCDRAAETLTVEAIGGTGDYGRMTKGMALAIKAKTLVYAASPLYNKSGNSNPVLGYTDPSGVTERWAAAAGACADVINLNTDGSMTPGGTKYYKLLSSADGITYDNLFYKSDNLLFPEYIVFYTNAKANGFERAHFPPTLSITSGGGTAPTQDLVDAFTLKDGSDYVRPANGDPLYGNRDPRFDAVIGYEGSNYKAGKTNRIIYTHVGDGATIDALNSVYNRSTTTGYYMAKFCYKATNFSANKPGSVFHLWPIIRLGDVYLLYAEAMNWAYGPDSDPEGYGMTAVDAVKAIRKRAGFAASDKFLTGVSTSDQLMAKIKQERRVELCFEEQRYFDVRRWMDGGEFDQPIHGIRIEKKGKVLSYDYFEADSYRKFEARMYYHPIPKGVIQRSNGVIRQNPGW